MKRILILLLLLSVVVAEEVVDNPPVIIDFPDFPEFPDIGGEVDRVITSIDGVVSTVTNLPEEIINTLVSKFKTKMEDTSNELAEAVEWSLTTNINPEVMRGGWRSNASLVSLFFGLAIVWAGLKFILGARDTESRQMAKKYVEGVNVAIVLVNISFDLYLLGLGLIEGLSAWAMQSLPYQFFNTQGNLIVASLFAFSLGVFDMSLLLRMVGILAGAIILPWAVFLFSFPVTKGWGRAILSVIVIFMLLQFVDVVLLSTFGIVSASFPEHLSAHAVFASSFGLLATSFVNFLVMIFGAYFELVHGTVSRTVGVVGNGVRLYASAKTGGLLK